MTWNPYSLKKPCKNCPFLKDKTKAIDLHPDRVPGIIQDLLTGEASSFMCHKTVYNPKTGGTHVEADDEAVYLQSGNEQQCAGSIIAMQKRNHNTQLMQIMGGLGVYNEEDFKPYHDMVIDPES